MSVSVPLWKGLFTKSISLKALREALAEYYQGAGLISVEEAPEDGFLPANLLAGTNRLNLYVLGNDRQMTLVSLLDNLGKGAAGAAVQNMNLALGLDEYESLA